MLTPTEPPHRPDGGFTLIEMLLCVALVGIIGGAIASSLLVMISTQQRTTGMLAVSQDRQLVANYFNDDVAGATTVATGAQPVCGSTVTSLVVLTGSDSEPPTSSLPLPPAPVSATTTVAWSYVAGTPAGSLVRTSCRNGGTPSTQDRRAQRGVDPGDQRLVRERRLPGRRPEAGAGVPHRPPGQRCPAGPVRPAEARVKRLHGPDPQAGASLVLVLVFVASFGLIVPALLTAAQTSVGTVAFTRTVVERNADAESAADRAINELRQGAYYNDPAQRCFHDPADPAGLNDSDVRSYGAVVVGGQTKVRPTVVTCQAVPDTGAPSSVMVPVTAANRPGQALLTLGRDSGERGIRQTANNTLRIQGRVFSNSTVEVTNPNAKIDVDNAALIARGDCLGPGTVLGTPKSCNDTTQDALGVDPAYVLPTSAPAFASAPSCTGPSRAWALSPGTYTSASALSDLTKNSCGALLHFTPGTYYFDFTDATPVWSVTDGYVIGGEIPADPARAWTLGAYPGTRPVVPGACVEPIEKVGTGPTARFNHGVTFIFGGESRMEISGGGKVELCGQYDAARPPIAIFGANAGSGSGPVTRTVTMDSATSTGNPSFEDRPRIAVKDGSTSDAVLVGNGSKDSATVAVKLLTPAVPTGAVLLDAKLRVAHRDKVGPTATIGSNTYPEGPISALLAKITPEKPSAGDPTPPTVTPAAQPVIRNDLATDPVREDTLDVTSGLKSYFDAHGFKGAEVSYTATVQSGRGATAQLDAVQLDITYQVPGFRASSGCVSAVPYTNGSGPCALVLANGSNPDTRLYVQGTTYAPLAAVDVTLNNVSEQVFKFGVVVRTVKVAISGSSSFTGAVFAVPDYAAAYAAVDPLRAHLHVYVCDLAACTAPGPVSGSWSPPAGSGWVRRLSAQVRVSDAVYPPTPGDRDVDVLSWFHPR